MRQIILSLSVVALLSSACAAGPAPAAGPAAAGGAATVKDVTFATDWTMKGHLFTQLTNGHTVLCAVASAPMAQLAPNMARAALGKFFKVEQFRTSLPEGVTLESTSSVTLGNSTVVSVVKAPRGAHALACTDLDEDKAAKTQVVAELSPEQNMALLDAAIAYGKKNLEQ